MKTQTIVQILLATAHLAAAQGGPIRGPGGNDVGNNGQGGNNGAQGGNNGAQGGKCFQLRDIYDSMC